MSTQPKPARIHLLPAKGAPIVVVIRRKPSKVFHILKWNTRENTVESGSWFNGTLYPLRSDVSFDGKWMIYLAMGSTGETWSGICAPPWLKTSNDWENMGTWYGGGYWSRKDQLLVNRPPKRWKQGPGQYPFKLAPLTPEHGGEDESVLFPRMQRDGWERAGDNWGEEKKKKTKKYQLECVGDDGWLHKPTAGHPTLRAKYIGYLEHGRTFRFSLDEYPDLLASDVAWAAWDCDGNLIFTRMGILFKYALADIKRGRPTFERDLENIRREDAQQRDG